MENQIAGDVKAFCDKLKALFPEVRHIEVSTSMSGIQVTLFDSGDYEATTKMFRRLGIGNREKKVVADCGTPYCVVKGEMDGVQVRAFPVNGSLPPTCKIETVMEKVLKTATVETGEYIEVPRMKVVCG